MAEMYSFNGTVLPYPSIIDSYPKAGIFYSPEIDTYAVCGISSNGRFEYSTQSSFSPFWMNSIEQNGFGFGYSKYYLINGEWEHQKSSSGTGSAAVTIAPYETAEQKDVRHIWTNCGVYDSSGSSLIYPGTEPVPALVNDTDHTAMIQGWIVGKRLAAMRGKKLPGDITDATFENGVLYIKNASAVQNGSILEVK